MVFVCATTGQGDPPDNMRVRSSLVIWIDTQIKMVVYLLKSHKATLLVKKEW